MTLEMPQPDVAKWGLSVNVSFARRNGVADVGSAASPMPQAGASGWGLRRATLGGTTNSVGMLPDSLLYSLFLVRRLLLSCVRARLVSSFASLHDLLPPLLSSDKPLSFLFCLGLCVKIMRS